MITKNHSDFFSAAFAQFYSVILDKKTCKWRCVCVFCEMSTKELANIVTVATMKGRQVSRRKK